MNRSLRTTILVVSTAVSALLAATTAVSAQGTVIASDNFNRSDESPFAVGGNWARVIAGNYDGVSDLSGNQVMSVSNEGIYYWQGAGTFSNTRQFARQRVVSNQGEIGLVLLGGADHSIMVGWGPPGGNNTVYIYWYSDGLDRGQLLTGPSTLANGDIIEATLDQGTIYAKVNGVTVLSVPNTTTLTSGKPGFITYRNLGQPADIGILDDWEAGTPPSVTISGLITESSVGLENVLVTASGGFAGSAVTDVNGLYTITGVPVNAASILLTPTLSGHTMSPLTRTVPGPVAADVTGQDFTSTENTGFVLTTQGSHGSVTRDLVLAQYPTGTDVELTPVPDAGYAFASWSGDVPVGHETDNPLTVTMDQDRTITANFVSPNVIASDDFNRANETPLTVGGNWLQPFSAGTVNLAGNQVAGAGGEALYYWNGPGTFQNTRQFARSRVVNAGGQVGLILLGAPNQALVTAWNAGTLYIYWYSGGSYQGNLTTMSSTLQNGDRIEAELESGVVHAKINGVTVLSVANTTSLTSGRPGFETFQTGASFDDWEAGTPESNSISGTITENAVGLANVLVTASGGFGGSDLTDGNGAYTIGGVPPGATSILLTPILGGHTMSPLTRTVAGPVTANVTGQDFTSTLNTTATLTVNAAHGAVTVDPAGGTYPIGTEVTLTPVPDAGYAFSSWSGDVPAGHESDNPLVVTMNQDRTIAAHFLAPGVVASDNFNRPNESPLTVGGNWQHPFSGGFANLIGNQVLGASAEALYYWQGPGTFDNTRQFSRVRVVEATGQVGCILLGGPGQALVVAWSSGRLVIYWYTGGSHHGELVNEPLALQDGDIFEGVLDAGLIRAKVNGVTVRTVANTTSLTSGRPGFETFLSGVIFDDWEGGIPPAHTISGTITENATGLSNVLVTASGGFSGSDLTDGNGLYTIPGVPEGATSILLTPTLSGHTMSPLTRTVAGPVMADVTGQNFTSTLNAGFVLTIVSSHGSVTREPNLAEYPFGTDVTLTPVPDAGYAFVSWSGDVPAGHETDNPLHVIMNADRTITATFGSPNVVATDDFNRANETPLAVGGNWVQPFSAGTVNLNGNHIVAGGGEALYYWQGPGSFHPTRQFARARVVQASGQVGLVLLGSPNKALVAAWNAGTLYIYWYTGGANQGPLTTVASTLQNGDLIEAEIDNGIIRAKKNGITVATVANTTSLTSGQPGFEMFQTGASFDDWEAGPPAAPPNAISAVSPSGCISSVQTCRTVAVTIARTDPTAVRAYSVTVQLSAELELCGTPGASITQGPYLSAIGTTSFQVVSNGGGSYTVDCSILGVPCGATASSGTLFNVTVKKATGGLDGTGTVSVGSLILRDCPNASLVVTAGGSASITIDTSAPASVAALAPAQVMSGNDGNGTTKITLTWPAVEPGAVVEVYRAGFGSYPEYDDAGGSVPAVPAYPPGPVWTLTGVTASGGQDEPATRDFWYYVAFVKDACGNVSAVSNLTGGTLDYHLGDVSNGIAAGAGDNQVGTPDISLLGANYGIVGAAVLPVNYLDVGPTTDFSVHARPTTDNVINFEDLILFAINFANVSAPVVIAEPGTMPAADRLAIETTGDLSVGGTIEAGLVFEGSGRVQGISTRLSWNPRMVEPVGFDAGRLALERNAVVLSPDPGAVDVAALGAGEVGLAGSGALASLRFRVIGEGDPAIALASVVARDRENRDVPVETTLRASSLIPGETRLLPVAPNPTRGASILSFALARPGRVELSIHAVDGRLVRTLVKEERAAGLHQVNWDGADDGGRSLAAGVYYATLVTAEGRQNRRITMIP